MVIGFKKYYLKPGYFVKTLMKAVALENVSIIYLSSSQAKCTNLTSLVCLLNEVALGCGRAMSGKRELVFCY